MERWCNLQYQVVHNISTPTHPYPPTAVPGGTQYPLPHTFNICSIRWNAEATCSTRWYTVFPTPISLRIFSARWHTDTNCNTRWYTLRTPTPLYSCSARWCAVINCSTRWYTVLPHYLQCQVALICQLQCQLLGSSPNPHIPMQCQMARLYAKFSTRWHALLPIPISLCSAMWNNDTSCSTRWYACAPHPHTPQYPQCHVVRSFYAIREWGHQWQAGNQQCRTKVQTGYHAVGNRSIFHSDINYKWLLRNVMFNEEKK